MLETTQNMYEAFLDGIKKPNTSIVNPEQFNRIINGWGQDEYLRNKSSYTEFNQKVIEDLEKIRCATDGLFSYDSVVLFPIAPDTDFDYQFSIPKYVMTGINNRLANGTVGTQTYPQYMRFLNVMFKITYGSENECELTGNSGWIKADIMRSDQRSVVENNPFRKPKDSKLLYEFRNGKINLITGTNSVGYSMRLEYLRYPITIFFDKDNPPDYPTGGSINCEFAPQQRKEIVDIAVRTYLERVKDPRYQSFLNEEAIKQNSK
jgi:hypothetical protein